MFGSESQNADEGHMDLAKTLLGGFLPPSKPSDNGKTIYQDV
jgi:hypothetical protein